MSVDEASFNVALTDQTFLEWIEEHNLSCQEVRSLYESWRKLSQIYQELEFSVLSMDFFVIPL
jgi:hypothetical protein